MIPAAIILAIAIIGAAAQDYLNALIVSKTAGFRHSSIGPAKDMLQRYAANSSCDSLNLTFVESDSQVATAFASAESLALYDVVVFLMTTGDVLNDSQQDAMQSWYRTGKGFVGVHSATDTEYEWEWYGNLTGTFFSGHPSIQEADMYITTEYLNHLSLYGYRNAKNPVSRTEEWYNFRSSLPSTISILITVDESTYSGGTMGTIHPISWFQEFENGRSFYTAMGHRNEAFDGSDTAFEKHLIGGIYYVAGNKFNDSAVACLGAPAPPAPNAGSSFSVNLPVLSFCLMTMMLFL